MTARRVIPLIAWVAFTAAPGSVWSEDHPAKAPSPKAMEALQALESRDEYERQKGFLHLEALREPATAETIRRYLHHKDPEMRAYSLRALAAIEGAQAVPTLLESLKTEKHPRVRRAALLGLEPLQPASPEILPAFIAALRDHDTQVRMTAVDIVSRLKDPRAKAAILERNKREGRRDVRRVLALAMKRLEP